MTSTVRWVALCLATLLTPHVAFAQAGDVPYVPTPSNVVEAMLDMAKVGPGDFVIDLGSGDGRIVITAAKKYGARGFGVDLDGSLVSGARREAERQAVDDKVDFYARNLFVTEIGEATVLTMYLFPSVNMQLRPRLFAELKPGTRVISHEFDLGSWKPDAQKTISVPNKSYGPPSSTIYMWIVPANAAGRWQWKLPHDGSSIDYDLVLEQTFQALRGAVEIGRRAARLERVTMRGNELALVTVARIDGRDVRHELTGRVAGDLITGTARVDGSAAQAPWQATRVARGKLNID